MTTIPSRASAKADSFSYVHEIEAEEHERQGRTGQAHDHWLMAESAAGEAAALRELLARWRGDR